MSHLPSFRRSLLCTFAIVFGMSACSGQIEGSGKEYVDSNGDGFDDRTGEEIPPDAMVVTPGTGGAGGDTNAPGGSGNPSRLRCDEPVAPLAAPIARLTNAQYHNTIADLLPGVTLPSLKAPGEIRRKDGFFNQADAQNPSSEFLESWSSNAEAIAGMAVAKLAQLVPCAAGTNQAACGSAWVDTFGRKAFRRPLTAAELARYRTLLADGTTAFGFSDGVALTLRAFLQSPHFLYRPEIGDPAMSAAGRTRLTAHELATRLSYFLWSTMPDDSLRAAAGNGSLLQDATRVAQVERLLGDARARTVVADFHDQWLRLASLNGVTKRTDLYPSFNAQVAVDLKASLVRFVDQAFWERDATLGALLTTPTAFVNDRIAPFYDLPSPGSTSLVAADMNASQRIGLLGQAGLLSSLAHPDVDSPTLRGVFVLEHLLCRPPPSPPGNVNTEPPKPIAGTPTTTRERMEKLHLGDPACTSCHEFIDGVGFGFNNFDSVGKWRVTENDLPIDSRGVVGAGIDAHTDVDGEFDGLVALANKLAGSETVELCAGAHWLAYARGLAVGELDPCVVKPLFPAVEPGQASFRDLLVAITASDEFRSRPAPTP